jgi:hypothetical protein
MMITKTITSSGNPNPNMAVLLAEKAISFQLSAVSYQPRATNQRERSIPHDSASVN